MAKRIRTHSHSRGLNGIDVLGLILIISVLMIALAAISTARRGGAGENTWEWVRGSASRFVTSGESVRPAAMPLDATPNG